MGVLDQCLRLGIVPTAWSPFGGGSIFNSEQNDAQAFKHVVQQISEKYEASLDQIFLAFLFKHPAGIVPIVGSSKIERIESAKRASEIALSHEDWYKLWEAASGQEVL